MKQKKSFDSVTFLPQSEVRRDRCEFLKLNIHDRSYENLYLVKHYSTSEILKIGQQIIGKGTSFQSYYCWRWIVYQWLWDHEEGKCFKWAIQCFHQAITEFFHVIGQLQFYMVDLFFSWCSILCNKDLYLIKDDGFNLCNDIIQHFDFTILPRFTISKTALVFCSFNLILRTRRHDLCWTIF